jgi:hypothetical protein
MHTFFSLRHIHIHIAMLVATIFLSIVMLMGTGMVVAHSQNEYRCFEETGFCIHGRIREFWEQNNGLRVFGYPITAQREEVIEGQPLQVQWFERNRLELHPQNERPYDVLSGRLGIDRLEQQGRNWHTFPKDSARDEDEDETCLFFEATGQVMCDDILELWRSNGLEMDGQPGSSYAESLALFGQPVSPVQEETIEGQTYQVQWFERARFELHPENEPPYHVQSGLLGKEVLARYQQDGNGIGIGVPQPGPYPEPGMPMPTATPTVTPTVTPSATPTALPTATPTTTPTATPTPTPEEVPAIDLVIDNRSPRFSTVGNWYSGFGKQGYEDDFVWAPRGLGNVAVVDPQLPIPGSYEVFAWWPRDYEYTHSQHALVYIYPSEESDTPYTVHVNLQAQEGMWNSLGTYYLEPSSFLRLESGLDGNVVADAFRFVLRSSQEQVSTPTPLPTPIVSADHSAGPVVQAVVEDLSTRLGIVQSELYPYTPIVSITTVAFDDCEVFPRESCSGQRDGWRVQVQYLNMIMTYRVSEDLQFLSLENPTSLAGRQLLYLEGEHDERLFLVYRYAIDDTWHLITRSKGSASQNTLDPETVKEIRSLAETYSTVSYQTEGEMDLTLYGMGQRVRLSPHDQARLAQLADLLAPSR